MFVTECVSLYFVMMQHASAVDTVKHLEIAVQLLPLKSALGIFSLRSTLNHFCFIVQEIAYYQECKSDASQSCLQGAKFSVGLKLKMLFRATFKIFFTVYQMIILSFLLYDCFAL